MDPIRLIIDEQICELRHEARSNRLLRIVDSEGGIPPHRGWPTRARRRLGNTLVAAGETLRHSTEDAALDHAA